MSLASRSAFRVNPSRVWQFYHYRREKSAAQAMPPFVNQPVALTPLHPPRAFAAKPNAAHVALAKFSIESIRKRTAPDATFTLITQNVDGLSARALQEEMRISPTVLESTSAPQSQSQSQPQPQLLEMHGRLLDVLCSSERCGHREPAPSSPICAALGGTEELVEDSDGIVEPVVAEADLPHCTKCGDLTRPGVVWFGEIPHHLETIDGLVDQADLCLVVGTSSTVSH
jgi:NAD+-dependent protein deacetylase sirtuin 5